MEPPVPENLSPEEFETFHQVAGERMGERIRKAEQMELERLAQRSSTDATLLENALHQLASPLEPSTGQENLVDASSTHPMVLVCQAIARNSGVPLVVPQEVISGMATDPVVPIARHSGAKVRKVVLKGEWWKDESGAILAFLEDSRKPVALLRRPSGYMLFDPRTRRAQRVNAEIASTLHGLAYIFYRPLPARPVGVTDLLAFGLHGCRRELLSIVVMGLAAGWLSLAAPFATGIIFDSIIPGADRGQLMHAVSLIIASAFAMALFVLARSFAMLRLEAKLDLALEAAVWDRLLGLPVPFFRDYTAGDLAVRSLAMGEMRRTLTGTTASSIMSGLFSVFGLLLLFYYSVPLALIAMGLLAVVLVVTLVLGYLQVRYQREVTEWRGRISGTVLQFINGIAKFRVSGTEDRAFARWASLFAEQKRLAVRTRRIAAQQAVFNAAFPIAAMAVIFWSISHYAASSSAGTGSPALSTGSFLAFHAAFVQLLAATLDLCAAALAVAGLIPQYERVRPILQALPESGGGKSDPGRLRGQIEVSHVSFRYRPDTPLVLRDVSFRVQPGEFVAFVGGSGSGKSTILRLLLGFERPEAGSIYYDGQDLAGLDTQAVRRQVGVVLQSGRLMQGDIFTNIIGSAPLTLEDAWAAARMAGLDDDINAMPMGMHTMVAEGGAGLSGGQRQRLMIARAIVNRPAILMFDEATSALDNRTQAIVSQSLEHLKATRIVIAHRLSTIMHADRIFVVDKGSIVQAGTYEELMRQPGLFAELAKRQLV
jgi:NHLM bacteriocin system ABC transporter ATP-binding protein